MSVSTVAIRSESPLRFKSQPRRLPEKGPAMGRAKSLTGIARDEIRSFVRDVEEAIRDHKVTDLEAARLRRSGQRAESAISFADARAQLANLLMQDAQDARNIETKCARAKVSPLVFDMGIPDPLEAA